MRGLPIRIIGNGTRIWNSQTHWNSKYRVAPSLCALSIACFSLRKAPSRLQLATTHADLNSKSLFLRFCWRRVCHFACKWRDRHFAWRDNVCRLFGLDVKLDSKLTHSWPCFPLFLFLLAKALRGDKRSESCSSNSPHVLSECEAWNILAYPEVPSGT